MDWIQKIFYYLGALLAASVLIMALFALSTAENGQLSVEGLSGMEEQFRSFYHFIKWFVYIWLAAALFLLARFLMRLFSR